MRSRASPRVTARATRRCWAPSWRSRSMRRRSASALSTAAVRLVSSSVTRASSSEPFGDRAASGPRPLEAGQSDDGPRGDEGQSERRPRRRGRRRRAPGPDVEQARTWRCRREGCRCVEGQAEQGDRSAPGDHHDRRRSARRGAGGGRRGRAPSSGPGRGTGPSSATTTNPSASGRTGSASRRSSSTSARERSRRPMPRAPTKSSHRNGMASGKVMSSPSDVAASAVAEREDGDADGAG